MEINIGTEEFCRPLFLGMGKFRILMKNIFKNNITKINSGLQVVHVFLVRQGWRRRTIRCPSHSNPNPQPPPPLQGKAVPWLVWWGGGVKAVWDLFQGKEAGGSRPPPPPFCPIQEKFRGRGSKTPPSS